MPPNSISLKDPSIMALIILVAGFIAIATSSAYVLWIDINTEYTWIMPLNNDIELWGYYKWSHEIRIYDLAKSIDEPDNVISVDGILSSTRLASQKTSYAIILARGLNIYVGIAVLMTLIVYIVLQKKVLKIKTHFARMILSILVTVLLATMLIATVMPYINEGRMLGYNVTKNSVSFTTPVKTLTRLSLNITGITEFADYNYVYVLMDDVIDGSLVYARFILKDNVNVPPLMIIRVVQGNNVVTRYIGNDATFYVSLPNPKLSGQTRIYILADRPLNNSLLEYTRLSFMAMNLEPPVYLITMPLIVNLLLLALGCWVTRRLN